MGDVMPEQSRLQPVSQDLREVFHSRLARIFS